MSDAAAATPQKSTINAAPEPNHKAGRRQCACGQHTFAGGECDACRQKRLKRQRQDTSSTSPARLMAHATAVANPITPRFGADFTHTPLRTPPRLQRLPRGIEAAVPEETAAPTPAPAEAAPETAAPETAAAIPTAEPTTPGETAVPGLLVADETADLEAGQMRKSEFLTALRTAVCAAADAELAAAGRDTEGCPYLDYWFDYYGQREAGHIERALRRYAPQAQATTSAQEYIPLVAERVRQGVARWASTGQISGVPEGVPLTIPGLGGFAGLLAGAGSLLFKARGGGPKSAEDPQAIQAQLGHGRRLDSGVRTRMESAFGTSFSHVQLHNDNHAAMLSSQHNARAFTVGEHVAFGAGEYRPGTLLGDALIAHELAHVVQQSGSSASVAPMQVGDTGYAAMEEDADRTAVGVMSAMWGSTKQTLNHMAQDTMPHLRSGLRLQRCATTQTPQSQTAPAAQPQPAPTSAPSCPPSLNDPQWEVVSQPLLMRVPGCRLQLSKNLAPTGARFGINGMEFNDQISIAPNCSGSVYFVQYVKPERVVMGCSDARPIAICASQPWGIDTGWPYPSGNVVNTAATTATRQRIETHDSPGVLSLMDKVRVCFNDEFVTYIVYEDANSNLTSLGWMHWLFNGQGWRDTGNCPPTHTTPDCVGWQKAGSSRKLGESFTRGSIHTAVQLNRSAPIVNRLSLFTNARDCAATECAIPSAGASGPRRETTQ